MKCKQKCLEVLVKFLFQVRHQVRRQGLVLHLDLVGVLVLSSLVLVGWANASELLLEERVDLAHFDEHEVTVFAFLVVLAVSTNESLFWKVIPKKEYIKGTLNVRLK